RRRKDFRNRKKTPTVRKTEISSSDPPFSMSVVETSSSQTGDLILSTGREEKTNQECGEELTGTLEKVSLFADIVNREPSPIQ
ncbi:MAG TPA: hypothetical protein VKA22_04425, partial [Desulfuromonadales bacterium]|nr:hypothetical protein [Desulfuromonadales bacterium]